MTDQRTILMAFNGQLQSIVELYSSVVLQANLSPPDCSVPHPVTQLSVPAANLLPAAARQTGLM